MSVIGSNIIAGSSGNQGEYTIDQSLRLRSAASAMFRRTPSSGGNRKTWTLSWWAKRGLLGSSGFTVFSAGTSATGDTGELIIKYDNNNPDSLAIQTGSTNIRFTNAKYRDQAAWHHVVVAFDTTQASGSDRHKVYVNGEQITSFSTSNDLAQDTQTAVNDTVQQAFGYFGRLNAQYFDGYLTEINLIDGQQLTASSFGEYDTDTGVWKPKEYTGSYGTNGVHLDGTGTSAIEDVSGNNNDYTIVNLQLTTSTASTYDSMKDVPTLTDEDKANYCTLQPTASNAACTMSNGNLTGATSTANSEIVLASLTMTSGKWYWEMTPTAITNGGCMIGVQEATDWNMHVFNFISSNNGVGYYTNGNKYTPGSAVAYGATYTTNDVIGVALDMDSGNIEFFKNNASQGSISAGLSGRYVPGFSNGGGTSACTVEANFGQRPFAYTPPSGYKAVNSYNLADSTIEDGSDYFNTVLYTGTGSSQSITGVGFQPDWTWIKERNGVADHGLYDAVRGVQKQIESSTTAAETTESTGLTAFGSDGFTVGALAQLNTNTDTYVSWNWKANGSGSSNTVGDINSTVSANTTAGFSVVSYTGNGTAGDTVGHGLGAAPKMIIVKNRDQADAWQVYHASNTANPETDYLVLNTTAATADNINRWNDTAPTSTVFSLGDADEVNTNTEKYIAYVFAEIEGYSAFGRYTGNGSTNGPFIYTGFRPAFLITKNSTGTGGWHMTDTTRFAFNSSSQMGYSDADTSAAEVASRIYNVFSNGAQIRNSGSVVNTDGSEYIYMAFAENPFKNSLAR